MGNFNGINLKFIDMLPTGAKVLDYGCGQGAVTHFLLQRGFQVVAADIDPICSEVLEKVIDPSFLKHFSFRLILESENFSDLLEDESFDCVICREVLEHIPDPLQAIRLFRKKLKTGGLLVVSVPTASTEALFSFFDPYWFQKCEHLHVYQREQLLDILSKNQFRVLTVEGQSFRWFLFWLMLAPFRVHHRMGNPLSHPRLTSAAMRISERICAIPGVEKIGNRIFPKSNFYYAIKRKPRILVIYDYIDWILGKWTTNIQRLYGSEFDIVSMSMFHAERDKEYARTLTSKVDAVHLLLPHPYSLFREIAPEKVYITTIHHWTQWNEMYSRPAKESDFLVTGAQYWKNELIREGIEPNSITVVHSGVEDRFFNEYFPLISSSNKFTVGFCGKMDSNEADRKGILHLKSLLERITQRGLSEIFRFVIAGAGWENFVNSIRHLNVEVLYLGFIKDEDMPRFYQSLNAYLVLSNVEGGPITVCEAMASRCVVISTKVGIAEEIICHGVNGFFVDNKNYDQVIDLMIYCATNWNKLNHIRENARRFVFQHMRYDETFKPLYDLYRKAIETCKFTGKGDLNVLQENTYCNHHALKIDQ